MSLVNLHEHDTLGLEVKNISRQVFSNSASIKGYTSEMQKLIQINWVILFIPRVHVRTTT